VLVGASWGAMLALAAAARHPDRVAGVMLVGCGTFDVRARARLQANLAERTTEEIRRAMREVERTHPDPAERAKELQRVSDPLYTFKRHEDAVEPASEFDLRGHLESWSDMVRLQEARVYPAAFRSIRCPVLMVHGSYDPHPGPMIREGLIEHVPHLVYHELDRCGHSPWIEEHARDAFLDTACRWLEKILAVRTAV